ncbi:hypothetical protein ACSQ6I_00800 [Anabaena sp. WFMT]|uniref:hypothetical protein n=1 Tax=Anabaena sp. WFMT TaxID=3449730 RepID=UPI003F246D9E
MSAVQIQQLLKFDSLEETEHFLKQSQISLDYPIKYLVQNNQRKTLADTFKELQKIRIEEEYSLEISSRQYRPNFFYR